MTTFRALTAGLLVCLASATVRARTDTMRVEGGYNPARPCLHYDGDGCSIPLGLPFFYKKQFTPSCDKHDVCYHCGVAYNVPRPRCDQAFRQNTLATCMTDYLMSPSPPQAYTAPGNSSSLSHESLLLRAVDERGRQDLENILHTELSALTVAHPLPTTEQFLEWFSRREVQLRMLGEWVRDLDAYLHQQHGTDWTAQPAPEQVLSVLDDQSDGQEDTSDSSKDEIDWCMEVANYLKTHNGENPLSSGMQCRDVNYLTCDFFSNVYYLAVRTFAYFSYRRKPEFYCHETWVPKCLPPQPSTVLKFLPNVLNRDGSA